MAERLQPADHEERMGAARRYAQWHLGDGGHADAIVEAYRDPDAAHEYLDREGAPDEAGG
jgi:hypothetical protein